MQKSQGSFLGEDITTLDSKFTSGLGLGTFLLMPFRAHILPAGASPQRQMYSTLGKYTKPSWQPLQVRLAASRNKNMEMITSRQRVGLHRIRVYA